MKMHEKFPHIYMFDFLEYIDALEEDYGEALRWEEKRLAVCTPQEKRVVYVQRGFFRGWLGDLNGSLSDLQRAEDMAEAIGSKSGVAFHRVLRSWIYLDQHELGQSRKSLDDFHAYSLKELPQNAAYYDTLYNEVLGYIECAEGKADSAELRWKEMEALHPKGRGRTIKRF